MPLAGPSSAHRLGLDYLGRDVLSRFLNGGRSLIALALLTTVIGSAVGTIVGLTAGYSRRLLDRTLMRACDVVMSFPALILALVLLAAVGPKLWLVVLGVALTHMPARREDRARGDARGRQPRLRQGGRGPGRARPARIVRREILPNITTPILVDFGVRLAARSSSSAPSASSASACSRRPPTGG